MGEKAYATQTKKAKKDEEVRSPDQKGICKWGEVDGEKVKTIVVWWKNRQWPL